MFVVKQKTADDVRISDWSSDGALRSRSPRPRSTSDRVDAVLAASSASSRRDFRSPLTARSQAPAPTMASRSALARRPSSDSRSVSSPSRSEEHTSELQSLMRISYAVFCLKKKKYTQHRTTHNKI